MYVCMYVHICAYMSGGVYVRMCIYMCIYKYICMYMYVYIYIYMCLYIACMCSLLHLTLGNEDVGVQLVYDSERLLHGVGGYFSQKER